MLNGAVKGEEEKTSLDGAGSPPIIASKLRQTVITHAVEGKREREWVGGKKSIKGAWIPLMAIRGLGCDGRWQLALTSEYTMPFFGPCWGTVTAQTLPLQLPGPPERPPPLPSAFATGSPWDLHQEYRLVHGHLSSSPQLGMDVWQVGFPLGPHT